MDGALESRMPEWDGSSIVGLALFDEHHKKLFAIIGELTAAKDGAHAQDTVIRNYNRLWTSASGHFKSEEEALAAHSYPHLAAHQKDHQRFVTRLHLYSAMLSCGVVPPSQDIAAFLTDWWNTHVMSHDKSYGQFLDEKGLR